MEIPTNRAARVIAAISLAIHVVGAAAVTFLGLGSAALAMTVYGHISDADLDDPAGRLEVLKRDGTAWR